MISLLNKYNNKKDFSLITGAAGLLGEQHARALLEIGQNVILTDVDLKKLKMIETQLKKEFSNNIIFTKYMDVSKEHSIIATWNYFKKKNFFINILINNAAIDPKFKKNEKTSNKSRFENFSVKQWEKELSVGLTGAILCSKIFGKALVKKKRPGVILNIASDLSVISPNQNIYKLNNKKIFDQPAKPVSYSVIKHGLVGLTKYLSTYWAEHHIRCNALSPGAVLNSQSQSLINKLKKLIPMARLANKNEYKSAVKFLCSDESSYMTGQNIVIDGGRSVW